MLDTCEITRVVRRVNEDGLDVHEKVHVYTGKCKVQTFEAFETATSTAGAPVVIQRYQVHLPWSVESVAIGDLVSVEGYARPFRITGLFNKTLATARRLHVEEEANA